MAGNALSKTLSLLHSLNPRGSVPMDHLRIFFLPFLAPGHIIPMVDLARLFANRGVESTVVTTAGNILRIQPTIHRSNSIRPSHKPPIELLTIPFPSSVPDNVSLLPTPDLAPEFAAAISNLRQPFADILESHRPDFIVTDLFYPWSADLGYTRIGFHGSSCFSSVVSGFISRQKLHESVSGDLDPFVVTGLPHRVEISRSQLPTFVTDPEEVIGEMVAAQSKSYGMVMNSFYELEAEYVNILKSAAPIKVWHVGPVSMSGSETVDPSVRGNKSAVESGIIRSWLDSKSSGSVLYVCFGSLGKFTTPHLHEIASGLEDSGHPFIWAVSKNGGDLPKGFEERMAAVGKGMVIRGWVPQVMILSHPAVGGFMTHCGWNSCLEGASAGVPMITWPMFSEQFFNEKLIVDVLEIGIAIGVKICSANEEKRTSVKGEDVTKAVRGLMGEGEDVEGRRRRAREVGEKARKAVEEGGSSYREMDRLVEDLINLKAAKLGSGSSKDQV